MRFLSASFLSLGLLASSYAAELPPAVEKLNKNYQEEVDEILDKAKKQYAEVRAKHVKRLEREMEKATKKGDLNIALAIRAQIKNLDKEADAPESDLFGVVALSSPKLVPGIVCEYYKPKAQLKVLPDYSKLKVVEKKVVNVINAHAFSDKSNYATRFIGFLDVPKDGEYEFTSHSDDGVRLTLNKKQVILHDGIHPAQARTGKIALKQGKVPLLVEWFQGGGGKKLQIFMQAPGVPRQLLEKDLLFHSPE